MTNAEAKEIVKRINGYMGDGECWSESEFIAMDKAIKALDTIIENQKESNITMNEIFDENGNYIYPTDIFLDKPNTAIGYIPLSEEADVIGYKLVDDVQ